MAEFASSIDLSALNGSDGFAVHGAPAGSGFGAAVASGDVNGDGYADMVFGAYTLANGGSNAGGAFVLYGGAGAGAGGVLDISDLTAATGFRIDGAEASDQAGAAVSVGDLNGDGKADVLIGAQYSNAGGANQLEGSIWAVYGGGAGPVDLGDIDGADGFRFDGAATIDEVGFTTGAGDINGDGFADAITSSVGGDTYVVFGSQDALRPPIDASQLDGNNGFVISGTGTSSPPGYAVSSSAGDFNGDGYGDVLVHGIFGPDAYIVYGGATPSPSIVASSVDGQTGITLSGAGQSNSTLGLSAAGDVNGDGFADILIAGDAGNAPGGFNAGSAHLVFGRGDGAANIDVSALDGSNGFSVNGDTADERLGAVVSAAGDMNGDGFADVFVASANADTPAYVVFGRASGFSATIDPATLDGTNGFVLHGPSGMTFASASSGDVNGDGFGDLVIGDYTRDTGFVVLGQAPDASVNRVGAAGDQVIHGSAFADTLMGLGGDDLLLSGSGRDFLGGGQGDDTLVGGPGRDVMRGGVGADRMVSLGDGDHMAGGVGDDTFVFTAFTNVQIAVLDGLDGGDTIDLSAIDADTVTPGRQAFDPAEIDVRYKADGDKTVFKFDTNGDGHADHRLVVGGDAHGFSNFVV